jgi:hypothetical protein
MSLFHWKIYFQLYLMWIEIKNNIGMNKNFMNLYSVLKLSKLGKKFNKKFMDNFLQRVKRQYQKNIMKK